MISKFLNSKILIALAFLVSFSVQSQDFYFIQQELIFVTSNDDADPFYEGEIHLKNDTIIQGDISLNKYRDDQYSAIVYNCEGRRYIPNDQIKEVLLFNNYNHDHTRFIALPNKGKLYRELYVKDSENAIYDLMRKPFDGKTMSAVHIMENNNLISIFNFWHSGPKADLLNYFEDRDQKKYRRRDFKNLETLFAQL